MTRLSGVHLHLLICMVLAACAKVADPVPPLVRLPDTTQNLELVQIADRVRLIFPLPPEPVRNVEVYGHCRAAAFDQVKADLLARVGPQSLMASSSDSFHLELDHADSETLCHFAVRFVNQQGRRSPVSNPVSTGTVIPADPPRDVQYEVQEDRIILRWSPPLQNIDGSRPPHIEGYLVNGNEVVTGATFEDQEFQFEEPQTYRIQTISQASNPLIVSAPGDTVTVVPQDVFPPGAPRHLTALALDNRVQLVWDASESLDLSGYVLYRGTSPNQLKKTSPLITITSYTDEAITPGVTYYYHVAAVDLRGNESPRSEITSVTVK